MKFILGNGRMEKEKEKESVIIETGLILRDIGLKINLMDRVDKLMVKVLFIKGLFKMV